MTPKATVNVTDPKLLRKLPRELPRKLLHSDDPWDAYGVIWAKSPFKGFDLLVPATNKFNPPARPDSLRGAA